MTDAIYEFRNRIDDKYEYSTAIRSNLNSTKIYTCYKRNITGIPKHILTEGIDGSIYMLVHNHPNKNAIFPHHKI